MSSCTACSGRWSGWTSSHPSLLRIVSVVGTLNAVVGRPRHPGGAMGTGTQGSVRRPSGVPVNTDNPRLRLSILGVVVFSLFAALFAAPLVPAGDVHGRVRPGGGGQPHPHGARWRRHAVGSSTANGKVIVGNRVSVQVTVDRSALDELDDDERQAVLRRRSRTRCRRTACPKTVEQLEERIADQRFSPVRARPGRRRRAGGPEDLDRRAPGRAPVDRRGACRGAAVPVRPPRRSTCSATPARSPSRSSTGLPTTWPRRSRTR